MTATNLSLSWKLLLLGLALLAPTSLAEVRFYDLKNPQLELASPVISQGGALILNVIPESKVWWNGRPVFVSPGGYALVALHRDGNKANLKVLPPKAEAVISSLPIRSRDYQIERIDGLPPAKVTAPPDPAIQKRIRSEATEIRAARNRLDDRQDFLEGFIWPVKGRISGRYGSQRILNGVPKTPHYGVDVAVPTGTAVVAPASGVVIYANIDMYYSGGTLVIDHGHGLSSAFLHLSDLLVATGARVKQGQPVAKVGATGRATGPHLDWRMNWGSQTRIDPQLLVESMTK